MSASGHALIIEDEMLIALDVEAILSSMGYSSFDVASSVSAAMEMAKAHRPDLITADYQILGGTGLDAVRAIQANLGAIPVVFVTGNAVQIRSQVTEPVVEKPINEAVLCRACEQALVA